jgi:glycerol-3-phosphate acyltransferase PlsX
MMTLVLDAMGSDNYPDPEIEAAIQFVRLYHEPLLLVGQEDILREKIKLAGGDGLPIEIVHAAEVLEMGDKPVENARKKGQNSMAVGMELVKSGRANAFVTAGNTGGAMVNALLKLGRIKGVLRPALASFFPVRNGKCVVLDIGANAECKPEFLLEFGVMGSVYAQKVLKVDRPRVGLISNGEEAGKGNQLVKDTHHLLADSKLNFIGNIEGKELFGGAADVAVTDGFTGNVLLKSSESVAKLLMDTLKEAFMASTKAKIGALLAKSALRSVKKLLDPSEIGAALLIGIDGLVFVGHGRSDTRAMFSALKFAREMVQEDLLGALKSSIQENMAHLG